MIMSQITAKSTIGKVPHNLVLRLPDIRYCTHRHSKPTLQCPKPVKYSQTRKVLWLMS